MIDRAAFALFFVVAGTTSRSAFAAWEPAESALVGTSAVAVLGIVAALATLLRLRRMRQGVDNAEQRTEREKERVDRALGEAGIAVLGDPLISGQRTWGARAMADEFDQAIRPSDRDALREALDGEAGTSESFRLHCLTEGSGRAYEVVGAANEREGHSLVVRDDTLCRDRIAEAEARMAALDAQAHRLSAVLDVLALPIWSRSGDDLSIAWCNRAYCTAVDTPDSDAVAEGNVELVPNLPAEDRQQPAREALASGAAAARRRHVIVGGERRLFEIAETPDGEGGVVGWARDVTDVEHAEADLKRHTEAHAEVLEALNTAIAIYAANTRLIFFNSEFVKLFRLDEKWLATEPTLNEVLEAQREKRRLPEQADWRAYKRGTLDLFTDVTEPIEDVLHLPDGAALRNIVSPHPFGGLLFMTQDVTDRFALERRHSTLTAVRRATLDNLHEAVAVFGADGRLKLSNPGYAEMWSLDPQWLTDEPHIGEILDETRALLDATDDWDDYRGDQIGRISERQRSVERLQRGDERVLDCAYVPLPDGATLITYLDVTDSVQVERALRERTEALETADRLKSEFIANVSYELRTPLNTVIGFTEILANQYFGQLNDRQQEYINGILESSQYLLSLINDILDLATVEAGLMVLEIEPIDVHEVLVSMLSLIQERLRKKQLTIGFECPREIGEIQADERRVKQVIFNLLSNAIKFTPAGGALTLGAQRIDDMVAIWVEDTGIGIDRETLPTVFEKFAQADNALSRQSGTGLGLSLVKNFVELHGGRVELVSTPEQGTTVTCYFPVGQPAEEPKLLQAQ